MGAIVPRAVWSTVVSAANGLLLAPSAELVDEVELLPRLARGLKSATCSSASPAPPTPAPSGALVVGRHPPPCWAAVASTTSAGPAAAGASSSSSKHGVKSANPGAGGAAVTCSGAARRIRCGAAAVSTGR
jgi:hypothetical protein